MKNTILFTVGAENHLFAFVERIISPLAHGLGLRVGVECVQCIFIVHRGRLLTNDVSFYKTTGTADQM